MRTIDKTRLGRHIGSLSTVGVRLLDAALLKSVDLNKKPKEPADLITLCHIYPNAYFGSGFHVRRADYNQKLKEPCTVCSVNTGFDYLVSRA